MTSEHPMGSESSSAPHRMVPHPEVAIGIPEKLVCIKPAYRFRRALEMRYRGPLTLADAVELGSITQQYAAQLVHTWQHAEREHKQFPEMPVPQISRHVPERGEW